jgi:sugar lactone lactonase YvrE
MKIKMLGLSVIFILLSCKSVQERDNKMDEKANSDAITEVASFKGQQVTGVTATDKGRLFVNFPRWRKGVNSSVVEIIPNSDPESYPNESWNSWEIDEPIAENKFIGVQSVLAFEDNLYVLDTRSQLFQNVMDAPRIFVFDLATDTLSKTYILEEASYYKDSYINDLRVDKKNNRIYLTDSGHPGLVIVDIDSEKTRRVLNEHTSTTAEQSYLTFGEKEWENTIHSDGIALDIKNERLFYHALTGYSLYSISTDALKVKDGEPIEDQVTFETKTAAPDGMIFDDKGNLYFADLGHHKIQYRTPEGNIYTLAEGEQIRWADTFSIYEDYLYFTNSRIHEVGADISSMTFSLNKIKLPSSQEAH